MSSRPLLQARWFLLALVCCVSTAVRAQTETLFQSVGVDTQRVFAHTSLGGATGIDFSFMAGVAPSYPESESHTLVTVFEWGPTATGPWTSSPDNVNSIVGGETRLVSTGVFHGPDDAPFVAIHFYAGDFMTVSGSFTHASVVPEPDPVAMLLAGAGLVAAVARRRRCCR